TEDSGDGSDAEGEDENGGGSESWRATELAESEADILREALEGCGAPGFVGMVANEGGIAEGSAGGEASFFRGEAAVALLFFFELEIGLELAFEVGVAFAVWEELHDDSSRLLGSQCVNRVDAGGSPGWSE